MDPRGIPRRVSEVLPGHVKDLAAARKLVDAGRDVLTPVPRRDDWGASRCTPTSASTTSS
jgi:hypothetical protein